MPEEEDDDDDDYYLYDDDDDDYYDEDDDEDSAAAAAAASVGKKKANQQPSAAQSSGADGSSSDVRRDFKISQAIYENLPYNKKDNYVARVFDAFMYLAIFISCFVVLLLLLNVSFAYSNQSRYFIITVSTLLLAVACYSAYRLFRASGKANRKTQSSSSSSSSSSSLFPLVVLSAVLALLGIFSFFSQTETIYNLSLFVVLGAIVFVALSITYASLQEQIDRARNKSFLLSFLFYLPCLINDLMTYLLREFSLTPYRIWAYCAIELILLLLLYYRTSIMNLEYAEKPGRKDSGVLLISWKPVIMDTYQVVGENSMITPTTNEQTNNNSNTNSSSSSDDNSFILDPNSSSLVHAQTINYLDSSSSSVCSAGGSGSGGGGGAGGGGCAPQEGGGGTMIPSNFSISFWLFPNRLDSSLSMDEIEIFKYGSAAAATGVASAARSGKYHPRLVYALNGTTGGGGFRIYYQNSDQQQQQQQYIGFDMSFQKWHFLVFTYTDDNSFNFFADGALVESASSHPADRTFSSNDIISIGDDTAGSALQVWAIREMIYSFQPMSSYEVANSFNVKKNLL